MLLMNNSPCDKVHHSQIPFNFQLKETFHFRCLEFSNPDRVANECIISIFSIYAHGDAWCLPVGADTTLP